ncbi:MAG: nucleotidyltransferase substrate binding protein [Aquificaceae bacterium]|uniref:nucleotidyltransferase substrate binding protein n=1 Tax=Hydrogenobacter sp. Uz 6-8 TaxID=3384828 RepID=UPI0030B537DC
MEQKPRWVYRLENYRKALKQLRSAVELFGERQLTDLEKQGMIQAFEYVFELGWNLLRDYLLYQGHTDIKGSRDAIRTAFRYGLIEDGELWIQMMSARNLTSHTYDQSLAEQVIKAIVEQYMSEFEKLQNAFERLEKEYEQSSS